MKLIALVFVALVGACGGVDSTQGPLAGADGGSDLISSGIAFGQPCTPGDDAACATGLCAAGVYDQHGPLCSYKCDPANPNPMCPSGCNKKGYCRIP